MIFIALVAGTTPPHQGTMGLIPCDIGTDEYLLLGTAETLFPGIAECLTSKAVGKLTSFQRYCVKSYYPVHTQLQWTPTPAEDEI